MIVCGLAGGPFSGKSVVRNYFKEFGCRTADSDTWVRELSARGGEAFDKIARLCGREVISLSGELDRKALRERALAEPAILKKLEKILHPLVHKKILAEIAKTKNKKGVLVIEVPLLFEAKLDSLMDCVICVKADSKKQTAFAAKRGMTPAELQTFLKKQWPIARKVKKADYVIKNVSTPAELKKQTKKIYEQLINQEEMK